MRRNLLAPFSQDIVVACSMCIHLRRAKIDITLAGNRGELGVTCVGISNREILVLSESGELLSVTGCLKFFSPLMALGQALR